MSVDLTTSNSYVTLENAEEYFNMRIDIEAWEDASENDKKRSLAMATKSIDRLNFAGSMSNEDQALQFPRDDDSSVPQGISDAACENALAMLDGKNPEDEIERTRIKQEHIADIKTTFDTSYIQEHTANGIASATAWMLIKPFLRDSGQLSLKRV